MKAVKTENHIHKQRRTQIITMLVGYKPVPLFGNWTLDEKGKTIPLTWDAPVYKRKIIHHSK